jgi:hypothetical protein
MEGDENTDPTLTGQDFDGADIASVEAVVVDALAVDETAVEQMQPHSEDPIDLALVAFPSSPEVVPYSADSPETAKSLHIVEDQYPTVVAVVPHHSFPFPNSVSRLPIFLPQWYTSCQVRKRDYTHRWRLEPDYCKPRIMFRD